MRWLSIPRQLSLLVGKVENAPPPPHTVSLERHPEAGAPKATGVYTCIDVCNETATILAWPRRNTPPTHTYTQPWMHQKRSSLTEQCHERLGKHFERVGEARDRPLLSGWLILQPRGGGGV